MFFNIIKHHSRPFTIQCHSLLFIVIHLHSLFNVIQHHSISFNVLQNHSTFIVIYCHSSFIVICHSISFNVIRNSSLFNGILCHSTPFAIQRYLAFNVIQRHSTSSIVGTIYAFPNCHSLPSDGVGRATLRVTRMLGKEGTRSRRYLIRYASTRTEAICSAEATAADWVVRARPTGRRCGKKARLSTSYRRDIAVISVISLLSTLEDEMASFTLEGVK